MNALRLRSLSRLLAMVGAFALLTSALASWVLPKVTPLFGPVFVVPGLALPSAHRLQRSDKPQLEAVHGTGGPPRWVCATFAFDSITYSVLDEASVTINRSRQGGFPFGYTYTSAKVHHDEVAGPNAVGPLRRFSYESEHHGIVTGALMLWAHRLHEFGTNPLLVFSLLFPMALLFGIATAVTTALLEGRPGRAREVLLVSGLFWGYLLLAVALAALPAVASAEGPGASGWVAALASEASPWLACFVALQLWVAPRRRLVPAVAIFTLTCSALHVAINACLALLLWAGPGLTFHRLTEDPAYYRKAYEAAVVYELERRILPWLRDLPTWQEVCPPFRRIVSPVPPAAGEGGR